MAFTRAFQSQSIYLSGLQVSGSAGAADEFPFAAVEAADAGVHARRERERDAGIRARGGGEVQVLLVWRLHVRGARRCRLRLFAQPPSFYAGGTTFSQPR